MNRRNFGYPNMLSLAALVSAILGIVTFCCIYSAVIFGTLAIVLGLLSRGSANRPCSQARIAICIGIIALILTAVLNIYSYTVMIHEYGSLQNAIDASYEIMENAFGASVPDM